VLSFNRERKMTFCYVRSASTSAARRCALEKQPIEIIFRYLADIGEMSNVHFGHLLRPTA